MKKSVWLIGAGGMALEYHKVLKGLSVDEITVVGLGEKSAKEFEKQTNKEVFQGGLENFLKNSPKLPTHAVVAVNFERLAKTAVMLLDYGVKNILLEKPGGMDKKELMSIKKVQVKKNANIFIAYNRRFYSSVQKALEIIKEDGGVSSFHFEFTEWAHTIEPLGNPDSEKQKWFLGNSTHVADMAFFIGGVPEDIKTFSSGCLPWHSSSCVFVGAGKCKNGVLFSYHANWDSPGRWSVEILTNKHRLYFRPMEKLQIQKKASVAVDYIDIDDDLDIKYKPGLFLQTKTFLNNSNDFRLCALEDQIDQIDIYNEIANY